MKFINCFSVVGQKRTYTISEYPDTSLTHFMDVPLLRESYTTFFWMRILIHYTLWEYLFIVTTFFFEFTVFIVGTKKKHSLERYWFLKWTYMNQFKWDYNYLIRKCLYYQQNIDRISIRNFVVNIFFSQNDR